MVKLLENTFRAVNISLVNEVAMMCDKLELNSWEVVKWGNSGAITGTRALYSPYVQSKQYQTAQHKATGWITAEDALDKVDKSGIVGRYVRAEIASMLA